MRSLRYSIGGLMGVVLVSALGMAALRSGSAAWASGVFVMACGILSLGIVGVACGGENPRAWWLGFTVFGWGSLALWIWCGEHFSSSPDMLLLDALRVYVQVPMPPQRPGPFGGMGTETYVPPEYERLVHGLASLLAATIGGAIAHALFGVRLGRPVVNQRGTGAVVERGKHRRAVIGVAASVVLTSATLLAARTAPGLWAGAAVLFTWGLLALVALGAVFSRGNRRARWLGAALFGVGYLLLVSGRSDEQSWPQVATNRLLNGIRPWFPEVVREYPPASDGIGYANARALKALDMTIPMHFPQETPLEDVLKHVANETRGPDGRGVSIYVDPVGLQEAEKTSYSPVMVDLTGVPLRTTLRVVLRQLGMQYSVRDGLIIINSIYGDSFDDWPANNDPFLLIGQCFLAVLAAGLGGTLAPLVCDPRGEQTGE